MAAEEGKSVLDKSLERVEERLEELKPLYDEFLELEQAVGRLIDDGVAEAKEFMEIIGDRAASLGRSARQRVPGGRKAARAPRGSHAEQVLGVVAAHPEGISVADVARELGAQPNYLYRVTAKLHEEGKLDRDGRLYKPSG